MSYLGNLIFPGYMSQVCMDHLAQFILVNIPLETVKHVEARCSIANVQSIVSQLCNSIILTQKELDAGFHVDSLALPPPPKTQPLINNIK